jgi:hypothetical protein
MTDTKNPTLITEAYRREIQAINDDYIAHRIDYTEAMDQRRKITHRYNRTMAALAQERAK